MNVKIRRATITAAIVVAAGFYLAGCAASTPTPDPQASELTVSGVLTLHQNSDGISGHALTDKTYNSAFFVNNGACAGQGGYSDIRYQTAVTIYDAAGTIVGTGAIDVGHTVGSANSRGYNACAFPFTVANVPAGSGFYQYEISHRGKLTFTADQASELSADLNNG